MKVGVRDDTLLGFTHGVEAKSHTPPPTISNRFRNGTIGELAVNLEGVAGFIKCSFQGLPPKR
jgi:hypothetical protein